ncbi:MAG TPA: hypothetical protein VN025_00650 [Candidatus Dormibacteraeota bacterium]|jgi:hypothetical protein|nr:hypothetical protein [Candidatus Dormibacteraeota bacterium]
MSANVRVSNDTPSPHGILWSIRLTVRNLFHSFGLEQVSEPTHKRYRKTMFRPSYTWGIFPSLPRDYIRRRRVIRRISNVVIVVLLSAAVAYGIVHMSGPAAFSIPHH